MNATFCLACFSIRSRSCVRTALTRANDAIAMAAATTTVAAMVMRTRTERRRESG